MDRDVAILLDAISEWRERPLFSHYRSIHPFRHFIGRPDPGECLIFLERITARWLRTAGTYVLIPNQERFPERLAPLLDRMDHVLCKSHHAREIFAARHPSVRYIGFTSVDRSLPGARPEYDRYLHVAGASTLKGTDVLIDVWSRHPEWPTLTVVQRGRHARNIPQNVEVIDGYLPDAELRALQNACGVHLCPSAGEGWGHYIVEAMSCGALVITTDGPPMNELIRPDRGVLVPYGRVEPRKLGYSFHVDPAALERAIAGVMALSDDVKASVGAAARAWYEANDHAFRERLRSVLGEVLPGIEG